MKSNQHKYQPPRLGVRLLRFIYDDSLVDDVLGDLDEIYQDRAEIEGPSRARLLYLKDAVLSFRNYDLRKKRKVTQNNTYPMVKNYLKIAFRSLTKNRVYSALNIMGLALGLAACLFIFQYVDYEYSYDKFHSNHENLYRVKYMVYRGGELDIDCAAAVPRVGPFMKEKMPEVLDFVRAYPREVIFEVDNNQYRQKRVQIVDPSFLAMFDYPLLEGSLEDALKEPNQVVLTESTAMKFFGRADVLGETVEMHSWPRGNFEVVGITADVPENSHLKYNVLISFETLNNATRNDDGFSSSETSWGWYDYNTYVLLKDGTDPKEFDRKFAEILFEERGEDFEKYDFRSDFPLQPITDIHLYSDLLQESEPQEQGDGDTVFFLSMIAIFILIIAWINYVNLSTAKSLERAKEVGVRKSMGAYKKQLVYQFLVESFVLNFLALVIAMVLVVILTPQFSLLADAPLDRSIFMRPSFWGMITAVFVFGSLLSGLYPAFILSSFRPIQVLKGKLSTNKSGIALRRSLVVFQFAASISLIAGTMIVYQQLDHMKNLDLGFDMTDTLVIQGISQNDSTFASTMQAFRDNLTQKPVVDRVTTSSNIPGDEIFWTRGMRRQEETSDKNFVVYLAGVDHEYFESYDIELLAGRNYDKSLSTDTGNILINYAAMQALNIPTPEEALGVRLNIGGDFRSVIGIVDSYKQRSLKHQVNPIVFPLIEQNSGFITVKLGSDQYQQALEEVQASFNRFFPGAPFDTFFLDEFYNRQYTNEYNFSRTFTLFALFAILVACLGLFGLTSFSTLQRTKEIGVRKVLGAGVSQIILILSKEFLVLLAIANVISWPIIYVIMNGWLDNYTSRISIGVPVFLIAALAVLLVSVFAVGYKTLSTARTNPVKALRYE